MVSFYMDNHGNSMANTCAKVTSFGGAVFIRYKTNPLNGGALVIHSNRTDRSWFFWTRDGSFKFLTYQLSTVGYWPTVAVTGNGELGFDSGEGA